MHVHVCVFKLKTPYKLPLLEPHTMLLSNDLYTQYLVQTLTKQALVLHYIVIIANYTFSSVLTLLYSGGFPDAENSISKFVLPLRAGESGGLQDVT